MELKTLFSVRNSYSNDKCYKVICILGIKFSFRNKKKEKEKEVKYYKFKICPVEKRLEMLKEWYFNRMGETLELENPQTFNEKIQWLKLYDSTPLKTRLADKYLVRDWIKEKIGEEYLIPLLGVWDKFEDIDFNNLPNQFVLKCNHGCGYNIIVKDKTKLDLNDVKSKINKWMNEDYSFKCGFEMHYSAIPRKIIAEKYIGKENQEMIDYKLWCFGGKVHFIQYLTDRNIGLKVAFFNTDWEKQDFAYSYPIIETEIKKPDCLDKMIHLAEILSKDFNYVRVDFYITPDNEIKFGEMTFTPASGLTKISPNKLSYELGSLIKLSNIEKLGKLSDLPERRI